MIASKSLLLSIAVAYVEARFGQEQVPIPAISAVQGGAPGAAATIAGAAISDLLGAANPCAKLIRADQVVSELGGGADAIAAAIGLVTAEKNTNPFANGNVQNVCADATLPATQALRGITPLIDPAVDVNGGVAALSKKTAGSPLNANGLSVFDLLVQAGFGDIVKGQNAAGGAVAGGAVAGGNNNNNNNNNQQNNNNNNNQQNQNNNNQQNQNGNADAAASACAAAPAETAAAPAQTAAAGNNNQNQNNNNNNNNNNNQNQAGGNVVGAADFGKCTPTITFQGGEGNRPATEFTFQIADPVARGGQGEALNPNIITNALCNQLVNVCGANAAAVAVCLDAKAKVAALNTRNKATADTFNTAIGFPGAITNPAGGPADVPAAAAAKRALRLRAVEFRA